MKSLYRYMKLTPYASKPIIAQLTEAELAHVNALAQSARGTNKKDVSCDECDYLDGHEVFSMLETGACEPRVYTGSDAINSVTEILQRHAKSLCKDTEE